jgi:4a-hydroxytetrahydrobiopterin dehydratase
MSRPSPRLLSAEEVRRRLADLPGAHPGRAGTLEMRLRAPSFTEAVRLIALVAEDAEQMDHHPDVDLRWRDVTFTVSTHSEGGLTQLDVELAHRILEAGGLVGATTRPAVERIEICLDVEDPAAVVDFWRVGLGYRAAGGDSSGGDATGGTELHDPAGRGPVLWFQVMKPPRRERGRFHLDVYVPDDEAQTRIDAVLAAGGRLVSDAAAPSWWVLADAEGNELCLCTRSAPTGQ